MFKIIESFKKFLNDKVVNINPLANFCLNEFSSQKVNKLNVHGAVINKEAFCFEF